MGVYIKGMEMPKDCPVCPLAHWNGYGEFTGCEIVAGKKYADKTDPEYMESTSRPDWCPLVSVPPHGRLIDADALFDFILNIYKVAQGDARKAYRDVLDTIVAAGDVIEAEEGEC